MNTTSSRLLVAALALGISSLAFAGDKKAEPAVEKTATHCDCVKGQESGKTSTCKVTEENKTKQTKTSDYTWV